MNLTNLLGTPHFHAVCLVLVSAAAIQALIAIWAATSRVHWFWRAVAVWAVITALLPIRAYQPALLFAVTSPLTIVLILAINARLSSSSFPSSANQRLRFGLRDLLLATAVVGLTLTSLLQLWPRIGEVHAAEFALTAIMQTAIGTLVWASHATARRRTCYAALVAIIAGVALAAYFIRTPFSYNWALAGVLFESQWRYGEIQTILLAAGEVTLLLLAALAMKSFSVGQSATAHAPSKSSRLFAFLRVPAILFASAWLLCLAAIYCNMLWLQPLPPTFKGEANNYQRLMELPNALKTLNVAVHQAVVDEAMALVEDANFVPYDLPHDASFDDWNKRFIMPAQHVRDLARAIDAEGKTALSRGDTSRACTLALANVRLGLMLQRGSTVIENLIGVAVQGLANQRLVEMRDQLSPDDARRVVAAWDRALAEAENVNAVIERDAAMSERAYGWAARLGNVLDWAGLPSVYDAVREADLRRQATARLLQADLAARLYQRQFGRLPTKLDDLVTTYLPALPLDPYSGKPLLYRTKGDEFTLYSVGLDRTDNGGKFTNMRTYYSRDAFGNLVHGYDYDLDTTTRP